MGVMRTLSPVPPARCPGERLREGDRLAEIAVGVLFPVHRLGDSIVLELLEWAGGS